MNSNNPRTRRWSSVVALAMLAAGLFFLVMVPFSLTSYTSIGFDLEFLKETHVAENFFRIRWPGDGTFRIGSGEIHYTLEEEADDVDPIDIGLRVFAPRQLKLSTTSWYHFEIANDLPAGKEKQLISSTWFIVPSWFPVALLMIFPLIRVWRNR